MNYYFNMNDLKRRKRVLTKLIKNNKVHNLKIPKQLEDDYYKICYLIDETRDFYNFDNREISSTIEDETYKLIIDYDDYKSINAFFRNVPFGVNDNMILLSEIEEEPEYPDLKISDDELISTGYDFYSKLPTKNKEYLKLYSIYTSKKNDFLDLRHYDYELFGIMAQTFPIYFPSYTPYFVINRCNKLSDLISVCHEVAHGIYFRPNMKNGTCKRINELNELEGLFFNYLTINYAKNVLGISNTEVAELCDFGTVNNDLIDLIIAYSVIDSISTKNSVRFDDLESDLEKKNLSIKIDKDLIEDLFNTSLSSRMSYLASYLVSTDLETIYKNDPEKAFWDFEKIQKFKYYSDLKRLEKYGITCFEDGYHNFNEKVKRMNLIQKNMDI